jgi:hypothetical protein
MTVSPIYPAVWLFGYMSGRPNFQTAELLDHQTTDLPD